MAEVIRDRIKGLRMVRAGDLLKNRHNWRTHGGKQTSLVKNMLGRLGYVNAVIARETDDGELEIIDGHLRASVYKSAMIPVLVVDLDDREMREVLAAYDPIKGMALIDDDIFGRLLNSIDDEGGFPKLEIMSEIGLLGDLRRPAQERTEDAQDDADVSEVIVEQQVACPECGWHFSRSEGLQ